MSDSRIQSNPEGLNNKDNSNNKYGDRSPKGNDTYNPVESTLSTKEKHVRILTYFEINDKYLSGKDSHEPIRLTTAHENGGSPALFREDKDRSSKLIDRIKEIPGKLSDAQQEKFYEIISILRKNAVNDGKINDMADQRTTVPGLEDKFNPFSVFLAQNQELYFLLDSIPHVEHAIWKRQDSELPFAWGELPESPKLSPKDASAEEEEFVLVESKEESQPWWERLGAWEKESDLEPAHIKELHEKFVEQENQRIEGQRLKLQRSAFDLVTKYEKLEQREFDLFEEQPPELHALIPKLYEQFERYIGLKPGQFGQIEIVAEQEKQGPFVGLLLEPAQRGALEALVQLKPEQREILSLLKPDLYDSLTKQGFRYLIGINTAMDPFICENAQSSDFKRFKSYQDATKEDPELPSKDNTLSKGLRELFASYPIELKRIEDLEKFQKETRPLLLKPGKFMKFAFFAQLERRKAKEQTAVAREAFLWTKEFENYDPYTQYKLQRDAKLYRSLRNKFDNSYQRADYLLETKNVQEFKWFVEMTPESAGKLSQSELKKYDLIEQKAFQWKKDCEDFGLNTQFLSKSDKKMYDSLKIKFDPYPLGSIEELITFQKDGRGGCSLQEELQSLKGMQDIVTIDVIGDLMKNIVFKTD